MIGVLQRLRRDRRGITIVEFAIIAPVMCLVMMGLGDILHQSYAQAILNGEVQKAARDSGIEGGGSGSTAIDNKVKTRLQTIAKDATFVVTRKSYDNFTEVAPEPFVDGDGDGLRDPGECYTDQNASNTWDADPGAAGQGGASAVTLYTITATYTRLFPVAKLVGLQGKQVLTSTTLLKNQPYASQNTTAAKSICT